MNLTELQHGDRIRIASDDADGVLWEVTSIDVGDIGIEKIVAVGLTSDSETAHMKALRSSDEVELHLDDKKVDVPKNTIKREEHH